LSRGLIALIAAALLLGLSARTAAGDDSLTVITPVKFNAPQFLSDRKHGKPAIGLTTFQIAGLNGASVKVRCHGCGRARHLRSKRKSKNVTQFSGAKWWVFGSNYVEVDAWRDGTFGRWARFAVKVISKPDKGQSLCYAVKKHGPFACLVKVRTGCLLSLTGHTGCPPNTIVDQPFVVPNAPAPDTTITGGPSGLVNDRTVTFTYTSSPGGSSFECQLDGDPSWRVCDGGQVQYSLADGPHNFSVRAVNSSGQPDPTPASRSWRSDTIPPHTHFTGGPVGAMQGGSATFTFSSTEGGSRFDCNFQLGGWTPCNGGRLTLSFAMGTYSLAVRAVDAAGNADPNPPTITWTRYPDEGTTTALDNQDAGFQGPPGGGTASGEGSVNGSYTTFPNNCSSPDPTGIEAADWTVSGLTSGNYDVYAFIPDRTAEGDAPTSASYSIFNGGQQFNTTIDQHAGAGMWVPLAQFTFLSGDAFVELTNDDGQTGTCVPKTFEADAVKFVYRNP
jgi:hypothetical protein